MHVKSTKPGNSRATQGKRAYLVMCMQEDGQYLIKYIKLHPLTLISETIQPATDKQYYDLYLPAQYFSLQGRPK